MLPGVELARKRRIHNHSSSRNNHEISARGGPPWQGCEWSPTTAMDESALLARRRLQEKLHGGFGSAARHYSFSWSKQVPSRVVVGVPQTTTAGNEPPCSATVFVGKREKPAAAAAAVVRRTLAVHERRDSVNSSDTDVCAVCLDGFRSAREVTNLPCSHKYHSDCVLPWLNAHTNCPCCRTPVL